jgi:hypothetical protein
LEPRALRSSLSGNAFAAAESFNFGIGHLRFILFMEWKLLTELLR